MEEANAAKYLYHFGVTPPQGDRSDPKVIFTSVYYSRKLADVMDDVGRKKVQTLLCDKITARSFDQANNDAAADALRSFGHRTDGKLPTTIVGLPPEMGPLAVASRPGGGDLRTGRGTLKADPGR